MKILFTGDLCPIGKAESKLCSNDCEGLFGSMYSELLEQDLSISNLECALCDTGNPIEKCGPNLKVSPDIIGTLNLAEFDVYTLANNHTRDFGDDAFVQIMQTIEKSGKHYVGGGKNLTDAARPLRLKLKDSIVSILSTTMDNVCCASATSPGASKLDPPGLVLQIVKEKQDCDIVLVTIHDGKEHCPFPSPRIRHNFRTFIEAGADAVIGHHPHVAQGYERYRHGFIAYSLGNFMFPPLANASEVGQAWFDGYAVRLRFEENTFVDFEIIPHSLDRDQVVLNVMRDKQRETFLRNLEQLNQILADDALCDHHYDEVALSFAHYWELLNRLTDAAKQPDSIDPEELRKLYYWLNHYLTTEEHLDVLQRSSLTRAMVKQ